MELPDDDGFLPILDVKVRINENSEIERKFFSKAANKGIFLNFLSHHPSSTKRAVMDNELRRAQQAATIQPQDTALSTTIDKLRNNGYPETWLKDAQQPKKCRKRNQAPPRFILRMPFLTDELIIASNVY